MTQATTTYLQLVNDAIDEAGEELASFAVDGSDFSTVTDPMMLRWKKWVNRAWRDLQQNSFDWEWMSEQAVVGFNPGIMFYSSSPISWTVDYLATFPLFNADNTIAINGLSGLRQTVLTGKSTVNSNFGALDIGYADSLAAPATRPLDFSLDAGTEYFVASASTSFRISTEQNMTVNFPVNDSITTLTIKTYDGSNVLLTTVPYGIIGKVTAKKFLGPDITEIVISTTSLNNTFWTDLATKLRFGQRTTLTLTDAGAVSMELNMMYLSNGFDSSITPDSYTMKSRAVGLNPGLNIVVTGPTLIELTPVSSLSVHSTYGSAESEFDTFVDADVSTTFMANKNSVILNVVNDTTAIDGIGVRTFYFFSDVLRHELTSSAQYGVSYTALTRTTTAQVYKLNEFGLASTATVVVNLIPQTKNFVHSWKSYNWSEETGVDDFQERIREIDQSSFILVDPNTPNNSTDGPLEFCPWSSFMKSFNYVNTRPGRPIYITEDNTGRWRFYPPVDRPYVLMFDFIREAEDLTEFNDVPRGLPQEYYNLIVWKAVQYYGEYDEQPSVVARGMKNYKNLLMRFEQQTRPKFYFKSGFKSI